MRNPVLLVFLAALLHAASPGGPSPGRLEGRLVTEAGEPVAGARIVLLPAGDVRLRQRVLAGRGERGAASPATESGVEGRFQLAERAPREADLLIVAEGFEPTIRTGIELPGEGERFDLGEIHLPAEKLVTGVVRDAAGNPLPGAVVGVGLAWHGPGHGVIPRKDQVETDARGAFAVGGLAAGAEIWLYFRHPGFVPRVVPGLVVPRPEPVEIELEAAGLIRGVVVDADGRGVADAKVLAWPDGSGMSIVRLSGIRPGAEGSVRSGDDGAFDLADLEPGTYQLRVQAAGFIAAEVGGLELEAGRTLDGVVVRLDRGAGAEGRVLTAAGEPVAGAAVSAPGVGARSDADGRYRLDGLPLGRIRLQAFDPRFGRAEAEVETVASGEAPIAVDIVFPVAAAAPDSADDRPGTPVARAAIRGRVLGLAREEAARLRVVARRAGATDVPARLTGGRFEIAGLAEGSWRVVAEAGPRRAESRLTIGEGQTEAFVDLDFGSGLGLALEVLLDGEPLPGATAALLDRSGLVVGSRQAGPEGRLELSGLSAGVYQVRVGTPEGDVETIVPLSLEASRSLTVSLEVGTLDGLVVDRATGVPVGGAEVAVAPIAGLSTRGRTLRARSDGTFAAGRLLAGRYRVTVRVPARAEATVEVEVAPAAALRLTLPI